MPDIAGGAAGGAAVGSMIAPGIGTVIGAGVGAAASIIAALIGEALAAGDKEKAAQLEELAVKEYNIPLPHLQQMVAEKLGPSAMEGVQADAGLDASRRNALADLERMGHEGYSVTDRAANQEMLNEVNQQEQGNRQALLAQSRARGQGGSGMEMQALLAGQQGGANRAAMAGTQLASNSRKAALEALAMGGDMAGQMSREGVALGTAKASAADRIAEWNASNKQRAQEYNLGLAQQEFNNRLGLAGAKSNAEMKAAGQKRGQAQQTSQNVAAVGQGIGQAATGAGQYYDEREKYLRNGGK